MIKLKAMLTGRRIVLKRLKPTMATANAILKAVDDNREHLRPWFDWEKTTKGVEDSLKYLFDTEAKAKTGNKADYGVYLDKEYIGNIGIFSISPKNKSAEIGYWLSAQFTKKGYMTEAVKLLEKEAFQKGLNRIQIRCDEENLASSKVAKRCGYILEGKSREDSYVDYFQSFRNTLCFSKLRKEFLKEEELNIK